MYFNLTMTHLHDDSNRSKLEVAHMGRTKLVKLIRAKFSEISDH